MPTTERATTIDGDRPKKQQSMSRVAHAHLQHAFKKANRSTQFSAAHDIAQLSEKVRDNEW